MRPKHKEVLNSDHIAGMKKGTFAFYVIGEIRYRDAFGKRRSFDYILRSDGVGGEMAPYEGKIASSQ
jgi:hypothetical protein